MGFRIALGGLPQQKASHFSVGGIRVDPVGSQQKKPCGAENTAQQAQEAVFQVTDSPRLLKRALHTKACEAAHQAKIITSISIARVERSWEGRPAVRLLAGLPWDPNTNPDPND